MKNTDVRYFLDEKVYALENKKSNLIQELRVNDMKMLKDILAELDLIDLKIKFTRDLRLEIDHKILVGEII